MPTFPPPPLKFRTSGFPQYGFKASFSDQACPDDPEVKSAPGIPSDPPVCLGPSRGDGYPTPGCVPGDSPHGHSGRVLPQYPRRWTPRVLRSGRGRLSLPSSPLRPDPPVSPAPTDFTAPRRLDRGPSLSGRARGHRRDLPGFGCPSLFDGRPAPTPGDRSPATAQLLQRAPRPSRNPDTLGIALSPSQP